MMWFASCVKLVVFLPAFLLLQVLSLKNPQVSLGILMWSMPCTVFFGVIITDIGLRQKIGLSLGAGFVLSTLLVWWLHGTPFWLYELCFIMSYLFGWHTVQSHQLSLHVGFYVTGGILYFIAATILQSRVHIPILFAILSIGAIVMICAVFFDLNQSALHETSAANGHFLVPSQRAKFQNRLYTFVLLAVILFLALLNTLRQFVLMVVHIVFIWIMQFFLFLMRAFTPRVVKTQKVSKHPIHSTQHVVVSHSSVWAGWHIIMTVIAVATTITLLTYVLFRFGQWVRRLWHSIQQYLAKIGSQEFGYTDEVEVMERHKNARKKRSRGSRHRFLEVPWKDLISSQERIRFLYRHVVSHAVKEGYLFRASATPKEILHDVINRTDEPNRKEVASALLDAYDAVRYGEKSWPDDDVSFLHSHWFKE